MEPRSGEERVSFLEHSGDDQWDEEAIHARAVRLHGAFVNTWPHFAD